MLVVGAEHTGGVSGYVVNLAGMPALAHVDWHMTITDSEIAAGDPRFARFAIRQMPIVYTAAQLPVRAAQLRRIIRQDRIDLLHLHTARAGLLGMVASLGTGVPIVYTGHGLRFEQKLSAITRTLFAVYEKVICAAADRVTFLSERDRRLAIASGVVDEKKTVTIRTRIDTDRFTQVDPADVAATRRELGLPDGAPVIGSIGRVEERKGPLPFVRAAAMILREVPQARFLWIGDGPLRATVEQLARDLGIADKLRITGLKPVQEMPRYVRQLDVLLFPSEIEGVPLSVLEAVSAGASVVSAAYPGCEELLEHDVNCYLFPVNDAEEAAKWTIRMLREPERARELARRARETVMSHHADVRQMGVEFAGVYEAATRARNR